MGTISRWVVPCNLIEEKHKVDPIEFDLTAHLKVMLNNEVWNRKFDYGFSTELKNTNSSEIRRATVRVFPNFISGSVNAKRIPQLIEKECGEFPSYLNLNNYQEWSHFNGFVIIETEYVNETKKIPSKRDLTSDFPNYDMDFIVNYNRHLAVLKEIAAFFLAGLHLSFPSESVFTRDDNPVNDGFFQITSKKKTYCTKIATNAFMHRIFFETSKRSNIEINLNGLASIWHYDLWSLKRYLNAVESDHLSMDNLLDLIYALEGLFDKSAPSDFVKTMCLLSMCETKKEARKMKDLLDLAYRIRNDIAHGERSYDANDLVKLEGKEIRAQMVYWKMKSIVAVMLIKAISKLIDNEGMKNLRFTTDDFINLAFK